MASGVKVVRVRLDSDGCVADVLNDVGRPHATYEEALDAMRFVAEFNPWDDFDLISLETGRFLSWVL
jgi:hypothetical protein